MFSPINGLNGNDNGAMIKKIQALNIVVLIGNCMTS